MVLEMTKKDDDAAAGLAAIGSFIAGGLLYYLLGPRCPRCRTLLPPLSTRCWNCGFNLR